MHKKEFMTWDATIRCIQQTPDYQSLVRDSYLDQNLISNVKRFEKSEEFRETTNLIGQFAPNANRILDVGSGNGISALAFARIGLSVTALEPDQSDIVGVGAINSLLKKFRVDNFEIVPSFLESNNLPSEKFDVVYARQAMHHAADLQKFIDQCYRLLKPGGVLITIRDHVVFNEQDKKRFLDFHPLHKYYNGENAYTSSQYKNAFLNGGFVIREEIKFFDSIINFFPHSRKDLEKRLVHLDNSRRLALKQKIGFLSSLKLSRWIYDFYLDRRFGTITGEGAFPGRMYSYICMKPISEG